MKSKVKKPVLDRRVKVDLNSLNASFSEVHRTKMTKTAAEARKAAKLVPVKAKISVPSKEAVSKTSQDLENLLKDF